MQWEYITAGRYHTPIGLSTEVPRIDNGNAIILSAGESQQGVRIIKLKVDLSCFPGIVNEASMRRWIDQVVGDEHEIYDQKLYVQENRFQTFVCAIDHQFVEALMKASGRDHVFTAVKQEEDAPVDEYEVIWFETGGENYRCVFDHAQNQVGAIGVVARAREGSIQYGLRVESQSIMLQVCTELGEDYLIQCSAGRYKISGM